MFEWMMPVYKVFGAAHPRFSLVAISLLGALLFGGFWWLTGREYNEQRLQAGAVAASDQLTQLQIDELQRKKDEDRIDRLALKLQKRILTDMTSQMGLVCEPTLRTYLAEESITDEDFDLIVAKLEERSFLKRQPGLKKNGPCWIVH